MTVGLGFILSSVWGMLTIQYKNVENVLQLMQAYIYRSAFRYIKYTCIYHAKWNEWVIFIPI